ncbi:GntR family transcriptional regulator [Kocuria sp. cx-455]|uniref:GntR family transcriptional regulator n=1 Tax=unclassified Candidatus Sulfotelmatobacter TaxID=2635724 RepID=UPI0016820F89|nr:MULTISPECIES: GntR family transcriptional regulator [unclassified Candidatus Sulfotelmatobacter]MBD2763232.1 GntR family transcriptional regulator [Kocuria sp. cx-116]MBD2765789.1 GntR family transcriptional regulator [Kocuria sp. cx-455]
MATPAGTDATQKLGKAQYAYEWIKVQILEQAFTPGYRLVLANIAQTLSMSVVPVREAIRRLEAEGLVTFERNVGARVSMVDGDQYRYSMEALGILEGAATAQSAVHLTAKELAEARELNAKLEESLANFDPDTFTAVNHQFHQVLACRCPNQRLNDMIAVEWERLNHLRTSTFSFVPNRARASVNEHFHILHLIETHAPADAVEKAVREHRTATLRSYLNSRGTN